jgi:hypothetical protein
LLIRSTLSHHTRDQGPSGFLFLRAPCCDSCLGAITVSQYESCQHRRRQSQVKQESRGEPTTERKEERAKK